MAQAGGTGSYNNPLKKFKYATTTSHRDAVAKDYIDWSSSASKAVRGKFWIGGSNPR
jgi:hypothetical protein